MRDAGQLHAVRLDLAIQTAERILVRRRVLIDDADTLETELAEVRKDVADFLLVAGPPEQHVRTAELTRGKRCVQDLAAALECRRFQHGARDVVTDAAEQVIDLVALDQFGRHGNRQSGLALVVPDDILDVFAIDAAGGIDRVEMGLDTGHVITPDRRVGT